MNRLHFIRKPLAAAILGLACAAASAADFRLNGSIVDTDIASLNGLTFSGQFSLDLPAAGYTGDVPLTAFSISFGTQTYTLTGAAPSVYFDNGQFTALQYLWTGSDGASLNMVTGFGTGAFEGTLNYATADAKFATGSFTISAVPEPESYALMLGGLGLVGWMARRRKA
ncbi:FxDxF family PEP-CTERM protein [Pelomonas sp. UHG3]|uniref:FxDxF family PEP-CTERM protein n=1 Tax=Roseateles hydrophilus TaxID=2975054 RepID=A0ACC6CAQ0_9BURK|nr:FxDxF family PEP-CTERM protein [Pelomonas sp. UHG3]MCY4745506.1 FxDxF family PEP-CTERM protein [Pelomonas sp. UHG3]